MTAALPALVLRCRPVYLVLYGSTAAILLAAGVACLAGGDLDPSLAWVATWGPPILLTGGTASAYFVGRYCFARLILDDRGFRLAGPLGGREVAWITVVRWERRAQRGGPATLRIVHGPGRRRVSIPLIYEDSHLLEVGLAQGGFPRY